MTLGERLQTALDSAGWRVLAFRDEMKGRLQGTDVRGYTHPAIKRYLDDRAEPSLGFLRAAADVLGVRYPWLVVEQGAMTEEEEMERVAVANLTAAASQLHLPGPSPFEGSAGRPASEEIRRMLGPVLPSVITALNLPPAAGRSAWVGGLNEIGRQLPDPLSGDGREPHPVAEALRVPIHAFGVKLEAMPEEVLDQYVFGMIPGLLVLAQEARDQWEENGG